MLDLAKLGQKILEARKAQGLTQEQLGTELGVSPQAVSRWEHGESAPDIAIVPDICRVLGISADTLLGVDGGIGLQTLGRELARRMSEQKNGRHKALIDVLGLVFHGWTKFVFHNPSTNVGGCWVGWGSKGLDGIGLWRQNGLAFFAVGEVLDGDGASPSTLEKLRSLVSPGHWEIAMALLTRPMKERDLLDTGVADSEDALKTALNEMMDSSLLVRDHAGYHLSHTRGLIWAAFLKALLKDDLSHVGIGFCQEEIKN